MPEENVVVVPEAPASEQAASTPETPATPTQEVKPPEAEKPLTREEVKQMLVEATKQAIETGRDIGRRELQSQQSRNRIERERLERENAIAQRVLAKAKGTEFEPDIEGAAKDGELEYFRNNDARRQQEEAVQAARNQFYSERREDIKLMGLDPEDKRLDWALEATDANVALKRINASVAKIFTEEKVKQQNDLKTQLAAMEKKLRQDLGIDSVETSAGGTTSVKGIPTDAAKLGEWIKNNPDEYRKRRQEVYDMQKKGLIR